MQAKQANALVGQRDKGRMLQDRRPQRKNLGATKELRNQDGGATNTRDMERTKGEAEEKKD